MVELQTALEIGVFGRESLVATGTVAQRSIGVGKNKFPVPADDRLEFVLLVVNPVGIMRIRGSLFSGENGPDIPPVDLFPGKVCSNQVSHCGKQIDIHSWRIANCSRRDFARPAHQAGLAKASLPGRAFPFAKRS